MKKEINELVQFILVNGDVFISDDGIAEEPYEDNYDFDELYFDAMTDGQLGSYDDYLEDRRRLRPG